MRVLDTDINIGEKVRYTNSSGQDIIAMLIPSPVGPHLWDITNSRYVDSLWDSVTKYNAQPFVCDCGYDDKYGVYISADCELHDGLDVRSPIYGEQEQASQEDKNPKDNTPTISTQAPGKEETET